MKDVPKDGHETADRNSEAIHKELEKITRAAQVGKNKNEEARKDSVITPMSLGKSVTLTPHDQITPSAGAGAITGVVALLSQPSDRISLATLIASVPQNHDIFPLDR